eukprot:9448587-Karenia_brevis.AAC.1
MDISSNPIPQGRPDANPYPTSEPSTAGRHHSFLGVLLCFLRVVMAAGASEVQPGGSQLQQAPQHTMAQSTEQNT